MYSISKDELSKKPIALAGDTITCKHCGHKHVLICSVSDGKPDPSIMYYVCGNNTYLGAIDGRLVA